MDNQPKQTNIHFAENTIFHTAIIADNINEYRKFIETTKIENPVYVDKCGEKMNEIGLNLIGFIILGDHTISQDLYNRINRRIRSRCLILGENQTACE